MEVQIMKTGQILEKCRSKINRMLINGGAAMTTKKLSFCFIIFFLISSICFVYGNHFLIKECHTLTDYYREIDRVIMSNDIKKLILILTKLETCEEQAFGNGFGPMNKTSLQLIVLDAINRLSENMNIDSEVKFLIANEKLVNPWIDFLLISSDDIDGILKMLKDSTPSIRYYGLLKIGKSSYNECIAKELRKIVEQDTYIVLAGKRKKVNATNTLPDNGVVGGYLESSFVSPLRNRALQILKKWGIDATINENQLATDGVLMLIKLFKSNEPSVRDEIIESIKMFTPGTLPMNTLLHFDSNNLVSKEDIAIINLFHNKLTHGQ